MDSRQLRILHQELLGQRPAIANSQHLRRKIAWHLQAEKGGGLPESVRQYALAIARSTELRLRISNNVSRRDASLPLDRTITTKVIHTKDARLPMPGSLIVKNYKGQTLVVKVLSEGFQYDGRRFTSLSAIALEVTGTRWNGFAFFGLDKGARDARKQARAGNRFRRTAGCPLRNLQTQID
jgi:hypothetical protein